MSNQVHVKKNDVVVVIAGKHKGKKGKVLTVLPDKNRVVVEGVNMIKKHTRPNPKVMQGGIIEQEAPIAANNVLMFCSKCGQPRRVAHRELETGKKVRACSHCGESFDK